MPTTPTPPCSSAWCPNLAPDGRLCGDCRREVHRISDKNRPTAAQRGYSGKSWESARATVLTRDPICTCTTDCPDHGNRCPRPSTTADHHPHTRKQLLTMQVPDPDAPHRMRGMCTVCHNRHTARTTPGGWRTRSQPPSPPPDHAA